MSKIAYIIRQSGKLSVILSVISSEKIRLAHTLPESTGSVGDPGEEDGDVNILRTSYLVGLGLPTTIKPHPQSD